MAAVQITQRALADLERLFDFIAAENPQKAREQILSVRKAFELLADHPLLGRPAEEGRRELILSRGRYGYIAKYRWLPAEDIILILAVRHQLEAGYTVESTATLTGASPAMTGRGILVWRSLKAPAHRRQATQPSQRRTNARRTLEHFSKPSVT